jgi:hypothetical protein
METPATPDRMLVAFIDVTGMSVAQVRSLEASIRHYGHDRFTSTHVYDGGPVSLRVCSFKGERVTQGWKPVEESAL